MYFYRCLYDTVFVFFPAFLNYETDYYTVVQVLMVVMPAFVSEIILYYCSVRSGKEHSKKIIYRMLKIQINTCEENDAMYSSDEHNHFSDTDEIEHTVGPYNINPSKPYKPVFIVFLDMIVTITFVMVSTMYFWIEIEASDIVHWKTFYKFFSFIPTKVSILWFVLAGKNLGNVAYLACRHGKDKANRSTVTTGLYFFRIYYDFIIIGGSLGLFTFFKTMVVS